MYIYTQLCICSACFLFAHASLYCSCSMSKRQSTHLILLRSSPQRFTLAGGMHDSPPDLHPHQPGAGTMCAPCAFGTEQQLNVCCYSSSAYMSFILAIDFLLGKRNFITRQMTRAATKNILIYIIF